MNQAAIATQKNIRASLELIERLKASLEQQLAATDADAEVFNYGHVGSAYAVRMSLTAAAVEQGIATEREAEAVEAHR